MKLKESTVTMEYKVYLERLAIAFKNGVKFAQEMQVQHDLGRIRNGQITDRDESQS